MVGCSWYSDGIVQHRPIAAPSAGSSRTDKCAVDAVVPRGERRERLQPHVARHGQDSHALLLVVQVQLAECRILHSRACQVDAEVVRSRAAVRGPHAAKNRLKGIALKKASS